MTVGTKSILFGVHAFWLHPWLVALAWRRLYGFPFDPRLWVAFFVHDLGYWGKPNMDGPEGETHPVLGSYIMWRLFDVADLNRAQRRMLMATDLGGWPERYRRWSDFVLYHSRFYAKRDGRAPSRLCFADKLSILYEPWWLYLPRAWASGELAEYMDKGPSRDPRAYPDGRPPTRRAWLRQVKTYMRDWVEAHKDGAADTWTPIRKG